MGNKIGKIKINGQEYVACMNTRVVIALENRKGKSASEELQEILTQGKVSDIFWLLHELLVGGDAYAKRMGMENPTPPSFDELIDSVLLEEYDELFSKVAATVKESSTADVELEEGKNAVATQV